MSKRISSCRLFLILLLGGLLLVVGCCLCSTRRAKEKPLPPNVEVVADTGSFRLSPDGRRAAMNIGQLVIKDFADGTETPIEGGWTNWAWLNESLLFVRGGGSIVVDVRDLSRIPLQEIKVEFLNAAGTRMEVDKNEEERLRTVLQQARQVYVEDRAIIALAQDFKSPSAASYVAFPSRKEREKILENISYTEVLQYPGHPSRLFSHNGEMYSTWTSYSDGYYETAALSIYTKDGELLTEVSRKGYRASPFGWAHDDSGVYSGLSGRPCGRRSGRRPPSSSCCWCPRPPRSRRGSSSGVFADDFDRPDSTDLGPLWEEVLGDFDIVSGQLHAAATGQDYLLLTAETYPANRYVGEARFRGVFTGWPAALDQAYLLFGTDDQGQGGYRIIYVPLQGQIQLYQDATLLDSVPITPQLNIWYQARILRDSTTGDIEVYLDQGQGYPDTPILQATDSTYPALGRVGAGGNAQGFDFYVDWVTVIPLEP